MRGRQPKKSRPSSAELRLIQQAVARTPKPATASQQGSAVTSVAGKTGDVALTKADVGLPNVENASITAAIATHAATPHGGAPSWGDIGGTLANQADLQTALSGKAASGHAHDAVYAALTHNHDASYAVASHNHDAAYEPKNANIQAHVASAHAPANAQKNSDITKAEIEAKLIGEISTHTHAGGGSSPWTLVKKTADESRTNNTLLNDGALFFTMNASTKYAVRGRIFFDTNATADFKWRHVGPALPTQVRILRDWLVPGTTTFAGIAVDQAFSAADLAVLTTGTNGGWIEFDGIVHVGVAGGTFAFAWAQNTTNAGAATVRAGSYLEYMTV